MGQSGCFSIDHVIGKDIFLLQRALPCIEFVEYRQWGKGDIVGSHSHPDLFQLDYFPDGKGVYRVEKSSGAITADMFYLVAPGREHEIRSSTECPLVNLTVKFRHPYLNAGFLPLAMKVQPAAAGQMTRLFRQVISETITDAVENKYIASLRLSELLALLYQAYRETQCSGINNPHILCVTRYLLVNFNKSLALASLAQAANITEEHLCRIFKKETGFSPLEFLQLLRLEHAKMRLWEEDGNISDIAALTGFGKSADMNRCFRKYLGMSSREYRQKIWREKAIGKN